MTIIHPENRTPEHDRVLKALSEGADTPKLGICFAALDKDDHLSPCVRLAIARWNYSGYATIFQHEGRACVILTGRARINAHSSRRRKENSSQESTYEDLPANLYAILRKIHRK